ncbi:protein-cysteine N-palmitoyltransferase HHAT [Cephus cinctus]|uniref:Protein-cysteine N-palmitoyltransferase HHAT n=1 Tax=Cephus cinctus TaxID=211228 RepID=A0AAJ7FIN4_CEPCN|nr:protein-cysteine N-palmitoyltransferase HHAT [Cephus cinctus]
MEIKEVIRLNKYESTFYLIGWSGAVFYSIYHVHLMHTYFIDYHDSYHDFSPGWSWIGGKRDTSDEEWTTWIPFMFKLIPWIIIHLFVGQIIKYLFNNMVLCCWYIAVSLIFLWQYVGILGTLCILILPCISCLLTALRSKVVSWIVHLSCLAVIYLTKTSESIGQAWLSLDEEKYYMLIIAICWIQLRSISYSIDSIVEYKHKNILSFLKELVQNAAYCLYLPTLFLGPLILYGEFMQGVKVPYRQWSVGRLCTIIFNLTRYIFWLFFTEFTMHFMYFNALQFHPEIVEQMNPWAFYGLGYCMGQYFHLKYVVIYGFWGEIARIEDVAAPPPPKCIGRIHLYSDMWKHFDRGLYKFLVRYIYIPVSGMKSPMRKLLASFLCFGFVFLWHGMQTFIFIWSFLNFLGLTVEGIAKTIGKYKRYIRIERKYLSERNIRRFHCALASPLLAMSAISNFYFFAGQDIGNAFIYRIFHDSWNITLLVLFILYCCCQVSTDRKNTEILKSQYKEN